MIRAWVCNSVQNYKRRDGTSETVAQHNSKTVNKMLKTMVTLDDKSLEQTITANTSSTNKIILIYWQSAQSHVQDNIPCRPPSANWKEVAQIWVNRVSAALSMKLSILLGVVCNRNIFENLPWHCCMKICNSY